MDLPDKNELEAARHLINNKPVDDFCGLTPSEMHSLLYEIFTPECILKIEQAVPDAVLDTLPFFRLTEEFLKIIQREGSIKLTPLGALPKKVLTELYGHRFILVYGIERGIHKLTREIDCLPIGAVHHNARFAGLVKMTGGKISLTANGEKLLKEENRTRLFLAALEAYTQKLAWSCMDAYPAIPLGNLGWGFTVFLLLKFGDEPKPMKFYADTYLAAFPTFKQTFVPRPYSTIDVQLVSCYCLRTFERFLSWWGLADIDNCEPFFIDYAIASVIRSSGLSKIFSIDA